MRNTIIIVSVFAVFFLIDILTKYFVFDPAASPEGHPAIESANWKFIGWRSQAHYGTMFLDWFGASIPVWVNLLIGFPMAIAFVLFALFSKNKASVVGFTITLVGILGNTIDNAHFGYVRNIMYLPWVDRGTFNFADLFAIIGTPIAILSIAFSIYRKENPIKVKKVKKKLK